MSISEYFKRFLISENKDKPQANSNFLNKVIGPFHETSTMKYYFNIESKTEAEPIEN